jgi:glycine/D-amino acid oxidase-like deaminating enzyme
MTPAGIPSARYGNARQRPAAKESPIAAAGRQRERSAKRCSATRRFSRSELADDGGVDWDVAVVGMGVLGSAALRALAQDGRRAVGIEQYRLGHANGSSHGRSRAVRFLYHAPEYVAMLRPAIDGWRDLERESGQRIYCESGTLFFARPGNADFERNVAIMAAGGLPHERLSGADARRRFPAFAMTAGAEGVFNPDGGFVDADAAVRAFQAGARASGAEISERTRVVGLDVRGDGVRLTTDDGATVSAGHVILAGGAWTNDLVPALRLPIRVTGQTWVTMRPADPAAVAPERVPVWCDRVARGAGYLSPSVYADSLRHAHVRLSRPWSRPQDRRRHAGAGGRAGRRGAPVRRRLRAPPPQRVPAGTLSDDGADLRGIGGLPLHPDA